MAIEALNSARFWIDPNGKNRARLELIHFLMIIYSAFYLPIISGFDQEISGVFFVGEVACLVEAIVYNILQFRITCYDDNIGYWSLNFKLVA